MNNASYRSAVADRKPVRPVKRAKRRTAAQGLDAASPVELLRYLQRTAGNQAVNGLLRQYTSQQAGRSLGGGLQRTATPSSGGQNRELAAYAPTDTAPMGSEIGKAPCGVDAGVQRQEAEPRTLQRKEGEGAVRTFTSDRFAGKKKLEDCLNNTDRLRIGDTGDSVVAVQQALIDVKAPDISLDRFGADGKYGQETASAVIAFKKHFDLGSTQFGDVGPGTMGKLDEIFGGSGPVPPKPTPTPPTPKPPDPSQFNPELEDVLNELQLQFGFVFQRQHDAIDAVERDLSVPEANVLAPGNIVKGVLTVLFTSLYGFSASALIRLPVAKAVRAAVPEEQELTTDIDNGIDKAMDKVADFCIDKLTDAITQRAEGVSIADFFDAQRNVLASGSFKSQANFIEKDKPFFRDPNHGAQPPEPIPLRERDATQGATGDKSSDTRVARARNWVKGMEKALGQDIFDVQYQQSLQAFSTAQAQQGLGVLKPNEGKGTDLRQPDFKQDPGTATGVLELKIARDKPSDKIQITGAQIKGLNERTRKKLESQKLSDLHIPYVARENPGGEIGRNEQKFYFFIREGFLGGFKDFVKQRAKNINGQGGANLQDDAKIVLQNDIDPLSLKDANVQLDQG